MFKSKVDLIYLTQCNDRDSIEKIIKNVNINYRDKDKKTALFYAVNNNNLDLCKYLVENGIDIYIKDDRELMAIHYAILLEYDDIIDYFTSLNFKYSIRELNSDLNGINIKDKRFFLNIIKKLF